ncbi:hypothetical protein [Actinacidiphila sp. bgisy167]|uniref:hypothetical protein n=1 Tax=Actinacidiphila sp. bgisy167 TaxID=3413797 RepID=UPI003D73C480
MGADTDVAGENTTAFRFQVQHEFHGIPLGLGVDEDVFDAQMTDFARDYWGEAEELEPLRRLLKAMYGANARQLAAEGAVYHALGVFPIGGTADGAEAPERVSRCTLVMSVRDLEVTDPGLAAAGIAEWLGRTSVGGEAHLITLPAGPAVVHVSGSRAVWEQERGEEERFFVRIEVWIPFPDQDRVLLLSLSTPDVQDLFMYQAVLADVADTIAFGSTEAAHEAGEPAVNAPAPHPRTFG